MSHVWGREVLSELWWGKPTGRRPLERLKHRWEDNTEMDLK
jgi:hypothetical protein